MKYSREKKATFIELFGNLVSEVVLYHFTPTEEREHRVCFTEAKKKVKIIPICEWCTLSEAKLCSPSSTGVT